MNSIQTHPRLYASRENLDRLHVEPAIEFLRSAAKQVRKIADEALHGQPLSFDPDTHNALLVRARVMQTRAMTLAGLWWQTREERYRQGAIDCVHQMDSWEYWSWLAMRDGNPDPNAIYDLSYGENAMTIAVVYDWLFDSLSADERAFFIDVAGRRALRPFLAYLETHKDKTFWLNSGASNWNAVCCGGAGMLALAMAEELEEAEAVLQKVECSLQPFVEHLAATGGGWEEGTGYWNYGMRYAFAYLRSWENACGQKHPLIELSSTRRTFDFPLDFTPNGCSCSFGDAGAWKPMPFHVNMAVRYNDDALLARLNDCLQKTTGEERDERWPDAIELLVLHPGRETAAPVQRGPVAELYHGLDWGFLADKMPNPGLYAAVRGGSSVGSHLHRDLLSFHCVVGNDILIQNIVLNEYLDSTFTARRHEIFECAPASKNTLLINGLGIEVGSSVQSEVLTIGGFPAIAMDATAAMGLQTEGAHQGYCSRIFVLLNDKALLIVDRVRVPHPARVEARFFTRYEPRCAENSAAISGESESLNITFAATKPAVLQSAVALLASTKTPPYHMLRWSTRDVTPEGIDFATLLVPGNVSANGGHIEIEENDGELKARVNIGEWKAGLIIPGKTVS